MIKDQIEEGFVGEYQGRKYEPFFRGEPLPWLGITYPGILCHGPSLEAIDKGT